MLHLKCGAIPINPYSNNLFDQEVESIDTEKKNETTGHDKNYLIDDGNKPVGPNNRPIPGGKPINPKATSTPTASRMKLQTSTISELHSRMVKLRKDIERGYIESEQEIKSELDNIKFEIKEITEMSSNELKSLHNTLNSDLNEFETRLNDEPEKAAHYLNEAANRLKDMAEV